MEVFPAPEGAVMMIILSGGELIFLSIH